MTPITPDLTGRAVRDASGLREARAIRARAIRRRVISGALGLFVAAWLVIALVLVSGHDPALAAHKTASATVSSAVASSATPTASSTASSPTVSAVTTRQS